MFRMKLPYPPSINHYYVRNRNGSVRIGQEGLDYRVLAKRAFEKLNVEALTGPVAVRMVLVFPDFRVRDLDNPQKCLLDALKEAGVMHDDSQIKSLEIYAGGVEKPGAVYVGIANSFAAFSVDDIFPLARSPESC